jgi:hypothetical protein
VVEQRVNRQSPLKEAIFQLATEHWAKAKRALLLARVGQSLTQQGYNISAELRGQKLAKFVEHELKDIVAVLTSPKDPLVRGIVPASVVKEEADVSTLFAPVPGQIPVEGRIIFDKRLWFAFSHPVSVGCKRTIKFNPEIRYEDIPIEVATQSDAFDIPSELIIPIGTMAKEARDAELQKNILKWFASNKLDIEMGKARYRESAVSSYSGDSVLSLILSELDSKDRERVALPLDIVAKLLNKKVRRG